ncbi:MAG: hypothetical protein AAF581_18810 [Planctomycetota bacterium]
MSDLLHVCFICSGNICRSPFAEGLLRHLAAEQGLTHRLRVTSAGTLGIVDQAAHSRMRLEALACGFDLESHLSQGLGESHLATCDYIFGLAQRHVTAVRELFPNLAERTYLLGAFPTHDPAETQIVEAEIPDPIGKEEEDFQACFEQIQSVLRPLLSALLPP